MRFGRLSLFLAACVGLSLALQLAATTVIQPSFDQLVGSADYVVRATVAKVESTWRDDASRPGQRYISTDVTLDVLETIKGQPPQPLVLRVVGGRIGETELFVDGAPKFVEGQENILFVRDNGRSFFPLVGLMHGYFPVYRDAATGRAEVLRFNGRPLVHERELAPGALPSAALRTAPSFGMSPQAFRDRIRLKQQEIISRETLR